MLLRLELQLEQRLAHYLGAGLLRHLCLAQELHLVLNSRVEEDLGRVRPLLV